MPAAIFPDSVHPKAACHQEPDENTVGKRGNYPKRSRLVAAPVASQQRGIASRYRPQPIEIEKTERKWLVLGPVVGKKH